MYFAGGMPEIRGQGYSCIFSVMGGIGVEVMVAEVELVQTKIEAGYAGVEHT